MLKLNQLYDQLEIYHSELRKVKHFFKVTLIFFNHYQLTSKHFKDFADSFENSLSFLSKGDIHSEVHFYTSTATNFLTIFNEQVTPYL